MVKNFVAAIHEKRKVRLSFFSKEDGGVLVRTCAPMDFGPSRRAADKSDRFHLWDYDSDKSRHTLSILPDQVQNLEVLNESFDPSEFVTWDTTAAPWFIARNWGAYS